MDSLKESLERMTTWAKSHPALAGAILLAIVVIGYFLFKSAKSSGAGAAVDVPLGASAGGGGGGGGDAAADPLANLLPAAVVPIPATPASSFDMFTGSSGGGGSGGGGSVDTGGSGGYSGWGGGSDSSVANSSASVSISGTSTGGLAALSAPKAAPSPINTAVMSNQQVKGMSASTAAALKAGNVDNHAKPAPLKAQSLVDTVYSNAISAAGIRSAGVNALLSVKASPKPVNTPNTAQGTVKGVIDSAPKSTSPTPARTAANLLTVKPSFVSAAQWAAYQKNGIVTWTTPAVNVPHAQ